MAAVSEEVVAQVEGGSMAQPEEEKPAASTRPPFRWWNWANIVAYVANLIITYLSLIAAFGPTNTDLSAKYHTLVTPAGYAFGIWGLIFIGEAIAMIVQLFPRYRSSLVVRASSPWWLAVCAFQICWTFCFAREAIGWSLACMLALLVSLAGMALRVDAVLLTPLDYALLRFPFAVHLGWIICASAVNTNVLVDSCKATPGALLGTAILTLAAILFMTTVFTLVVRRPEPCVGFVVTWAIAGINKELSSGATNLLKPTRFNPYPWDEAVIMGIRVAAVGLCIVAGLMGGLAMAIGAVRETPVLSRAAARLHERLSLRE